MRKSRRLALGFEERFHKKSFASYQVFIEKFHYDVGDIAHIYFVNNPVYWLAQALPHVLLVRFSFCALLQLLKHCAHLKRGHVNSTQACWQHLTFWFFGFLFFNLVSYWFTTTVAIFTISFVSAAVSPWVSVFRAMTSPSVITITTRAPSSVMRSQFAFFAHH